MVTQATITKILDTLAPLYVTHPLEELNRRDPYRSLVSGILSSRTQDRETVKVAAALFAVAPSPAALAKLTEKRINGIIKSVGFHNAKAKALKKTAAILARDYGGRVPDDFGSLVGLPGVGRKVANLILSTVFGRDVICVDTHVHRITQRFGWHVARMPEETERNLMGIIPKRYWRVINRILVRHGQSVCTPIGPRCSECPVAKWCEKVGVAKSR